MIAVSTACLFLQSLCARWIASARARAKTLFGHLKLPTGKRRHIVADTNVSPFSRARNICCGHKCFWFCSKTFCVRNKCFPVFCAQGNVMSNNVSATMCPRLPPPLDRVCLLLTNQWAGFVAPIPFRFAYFCHAFPVNKYPRNSAIPT